MPLPLPNLDNRTYTDLINEARALIPNICPEWTDHNPADPGVILIEMLAWLTEMILYRINQVPEDNRKTFLKLLNDPNWSWKQDMDLDTEIQAAVLALSERYRAVTCDDYEYLVSKKWPDTALGDILDLIFDNGKGGKAILEPEDSIIQIKDLNEDLISKLSKDTIGKDLKIKKQILKELNLDPSSLLQQWSKEEPERTFRDFIDLIFDNGKGGKAILDSEESLIQIKHLNEDQISKLFVDAEGNGLKIKEQILKWHDLDPPSNLLQQIGGGKCIVRRVQCIAGRNLRPKGDVNGRGHISVVVVPDVKAFTYKYVGNDTLGGPEQTYAVTATQRDGEKWDIKLIDNPSDTTEWSPPLPTEALCAAIWSFLDERRLLTTKHHVVKPEYINLEISANIILNKDVQIKDFRNRVAANVFNFFNPLPDGGPDGKGWPFGRDVHDSEVYALLKKVPGVDYIEKVKINRPDQPRQQKNEDQIKLVWLKSLTLYYKDPDKT